MKISDACNIIVSIFHDGVASGQPTYNTIWASDIKDALDNAIPLLQAMGFSDSDIVSEIDVIISKYEHGASVY